MLKNFHVCMISVDEDSLLFDGRWMKEMGFCTHAGSRVDVYDSNGDHLTDRRAMGRFKIAQEHIGNLVFFPQRCVQLNLLDSGKHCQ